MTTLNYIHCLAVAKKFTAKKDLRESANSEYQWLKRNGLMNEACAHMEQLRRSLSDDDIAEIAKQYTHRRAFKLGDQSAYNAAGKRGILDSVCSHMLEKHRDLTNEQIAEIALMYGTRVEFLRNDCGAYQSATKRGILDDVCAHMEYRDTRRLSDSEILTIAKTFSTRNDFKLGDFGAYTTAIRRGLIVEACKHMEYGYCGFREDKPAVLYQFRIETADNQILYKIGITNRKPKQRMVTLGIKKGTKIELEKFVRFVNGRAARAAEKAVHTHLEQYRYIGAPIMKNGNTEIFTKGILS